MSLKKGSVVGITGKTGSGKSTLFHLMLGLIRPNEGDIFYNQESIFSNLSKWREKIGSNYICLLECGSDGDCLFHVISSR